MDILRYKSAVAAALGKRKAALVLKNAYIVNVFTEQITAADIAVEDGYIVGVGEYSGETELDMTGKYICPGFIDAHLHLESTLAAPAELVNAAMLRGTTTFIADPHEVANVCGGAGIDYILKQTDDSVHIMLPSCVPAAAGEENGCTFAAEDMAAYLANPRVLGLAEVMDYPSVINARSDMLEKLALFAGRPIDGHAPGLSRKQLCAYALAGIRTDHEGVEFEYVKEQLALGMQVLIREGSGERNLDAIVGGIVKEGLCTEFFSFCTDDKHIDDIEIEGHIDYNVRRSIALGIPPVKAIKMATINTARCYGLAELGAVAPGYRADLVVLDELNGVSVNSVYRGGRRVIPFAGTAEKCPPELLNTVRVPKLTAEDIALEVKGEASVIEMVPGQIITGHLRRDVPIYNGNFAPNGHINKVVAIERHRGSGHVGVAPAVGFNISGGAIGTSMSHDSHNIVIVGDSDEAILLALEEIKRAQGGYTVVRGGRASTLPLPVMGIMTEMRNAEITPILKKLLAEARELGVPEDINPFAALSFISLPVLPQLRITTRGLFDVLNGVYI